MLQNDESPEPGDPDPERFTPELLGRALKEGDPESFSLHLLSDDSEALLDLFETMTNAGFHVTASTRVTEALDLVARWRPKVLLSEFTLPEMGGLELQTRIREASPGTRVLFTVGASEGWSHRNSIWSQGGELIVKPFTKMALVRAVERVLEEAQGRPKLTGPES